MREKSKLEKWLDAYYDKFKENYPICMTAIVSEDTIIADIKKCISEDKKAKVEKLKEGADY